MSAKILVVEDNFDSREMLGVFLRCNGFTVSFAEDGCQALAAIKRDPPDLIITDLEMPNLNGIEMIRQLRQHEETRHLPVLVLTACRPPMIQAALEEGANAATSKPVEIDALVDLIRQLALPFILLCCGCVNF
ncbi:MAG: response regulator [Acidobacteria bacterium]|nr:response regulator [Acidobacteriota bacterium]